MAETQSLTAAQFAALAKLLRLRSGPAQDAARLVLVDGMRQADAAAALGVVPQNLSSALTRLRKGLELARAAVCA